MDALTVSIAALSADASDAQRSHGVGARWRRRLSRARASFWTETYRELRRQAGDERLPSDVRRWLRAAAQRSLDRSARAERHATMPFQRRSLHRGRAIVLPDGVEHEARR